jgi:predicted alpha/beta hydrolase
MSAKRPLRIETHDSWELGGTFFPASGPADQAVLIAPATGIRQHLYFAFAEELVERGCAVLTFDNRGIGESRGDRPLSELSIRKQDWGQLDMPAALDRLEALVPGVPLSLVGHSSGGQLAGLMSNVHKLSRIAQVACSSGHIRNISGMTKPFAWAVLKGYIPATTAVFGYAPIEALGWGEDLPAGVANQWSKWCSNPGYVANSFGDTIETHYYDDITCPLLNLRAADDPIATAANVEELLELFPHARIQRQVLQPADYNLDSIGHIDFFRRRCRAAWEPLMEWLVTTRS